MVILAVTMAVFIILAILKEDSNNKKNQHNIIYPFNAKLQTRDGEYDGSVTTLLVTKDGVTPQIQCPAGTHINILGSWTDVVDPNGICSGKVGSTFKLSCGFTDDISAGVTCKSTDDCAAGMECSGTQKCVPMPCSENGDCGSAGVACLESSSAVGQPCAGFTFQDADGYVCIDGVVHKDPSAGQCLYCNTVITVLDGTKTAKNIDATGRCAQSPTCANIGTGVDEGQNKTCTKNNCVTRDSSAYLANICDGKRVCTMPDNSTLKYDPINPDIFGPRPCGVFGSGLPANGHFATFSDKWWQKPVSGDGAKGGGALSDFEQLPIAPGWQGGLSAGGKGNGQTATYSLGFYVHGLYSCIPDE
uniref:Galactose binding lectin domain protein n=1 Tax=Marseillevirus LCMAC101 TaxID=2506602 RepID=A0A481YST5_9VIRU|nr:MAG: galactose binding lectin domain protein [Marseillevirus LCMAC101]